jgi:hypothetical protein
MPQIDIPETRKKHSEFYEIYFQLGLDMGYPYRWRLYCDAGNSAAGKKDSADRQSKRW